jgi:N-acylneuraminate cytidylyltransferase
MKTLAIITARGGSTRITRKNIKHFLGKPIISYPIKAALDSGVFNEVMVSTEDDEIANIAKKNGALVPFLRPEHLAKNEVNIVDVLLDVLETYRNMGLEYDYVACIYPTVPFLTPLRLESAHADLIKNSEAYGIMSVSKPATHPYKTFKIDECNEVSMMFPEYEFIHSQLLPKAYYDCAQFYILNTLKFEKEKRIFSSGMIPHVITDLESQDIDSPEDWHMAELKYKLLNQIEQE